MIIIGLGNPGKDYKNTHHNVGYMFVDEIAKAYNTKFKLEKKFQAEVAEITLLGEKHYLIKPITYMNLSGFSVRLFMNYYNKQTDDLLVVSDDLDLPLATLRIRQKGGSGGHKGMASIINEIKSQDFARIRIGIGRNNDNIIDYVLSKFTSKELKELKPILNLAPNIFKDLIENNLDYIMNNYNGVNK